MEAKMTQWVMAGTLVGSLALGGAAIAQQPSPSAQKPAPSAGAQADKPPARPATGQKTTAKRPAADTTQGETRTPKQQPTTAPAADIATTATALGTVRIPKEVKADGKPLPAGTYQVRLTADEAKPDAVGTSGKLERWVEFLQKGSVKGREVVSIVPQDEIKMVEKDTPPAPGASKVQMLKGNDYLRVWINKGGNHYLIHLVA
jgi:hypothetical protein